MSLVNLILAGLLAVAVYTDMRWRKIPNLLTIPGMVAGLIVNFWVGGWPGLIIALQGLGLGVIFLFLPFLLGGLGAGDVKLMALVGAWLGAGLTVEACVLAALVGGMMAAAVLIRRRVFWATLGRSIWGTVLLMVTFGKLNILSPQAALNQSFGIPYGLAIALGAYATFIWGGTNVF